jgi:hypothetical protein
MNWKRGSYVEGQCRREQVVVDLKADNFDNGLLQNLGAVRVTGRISSIVEQGDIRLGRGCYSANREEANVGTRCMRYMTNLRVVEDRDLGWATFAGMIRWGSLKLDLVQTWRVNNGKNFEVRMSAN